MDLRIKQIEDFSLNAWPSHQMQLYDGWILRFSYFYTHRTNCVEQIGPSSIPISEKIEYCEAEYKHWGTPAIFKITPLVDHDFDHLLKRQGYSIQHVTNVMTADLTQPILQAPQIDCSIHCSSYISDRWIQALLRLKHTTNPRHISVVPSMYRAIPKETIAVSIRDQNDRILATGLGIPDRNYIGVYAIHVHPEYRNRGYAHAIVSKILKEGKKRGADSAYLQVIEETSPAISLYHSFGFHRFYRYWFRVKDRL